ncbi:alpha/beta hydrolase [Nakamurella sp.]|uniref:alpha/beta hydrolase n=1 Tax=Nakamurella sp. TaxID=1869182 RepID=UPI00378476F0
MLPIRGWSRAGRVALAGALLMLGACTAGGGDSSGDARTSAGTAAVSSASPASSAGAPSVRPSGAAPAVPVLDWTACPAAVDGAASTAGFDCATATVPMDYADPAAGRFDLAVIKHPATDPGTKVGTLFWNPGGPSDAGTQYLPASINGFPEEVRQRFDIVSWDPRGMGGRTTPVVQCFADQAAEQAFLEDPAYGTIPRTDDEFAAFDAAHSALNRQCGEQAGDLLAHVSTADNARDLDLLRQAVGEDTLSYYGTSYGTFLGATYVNMFPDRVRAAVLDGAVSPIAWGGGAGTDPSLSTFLRVGSDLGTKETTDEFMRQCGAVDATACAFSAGSPEATLAKWTALLTQLKATPAVVDGQPIDDRVLLSLVQGSIYVTTPLPGFGRFPGWPAVAEQVQQIWAAAQQPAGAAASGTPAASSSASSPAAAAPSTGASAGASTTGPADSTYVTSAGRQLAVVCGESPNPATGAEYDAAARVSVDRSQPSYWPWVAYCVDWSARASEAYVGPWNNPTPVPVLVVGNTFDPATPYTSSQAMADALADGHLLTVDGFGHTELLNPSACAQQHISDYLLNGTVPADGTRCAQDRAPFATG